jgi:hypothetical protein
MIISTEVSNEAFGVVRFLVAVCGVGLWAHYLCTANYLRDASHKARISTVAIATSGALMAVSSAFGSVLWMAGSTFAALASTLVFQLIVWSSGVFVSDHLDRAHRLKKRIQRQVRDVCEPAVQLSEYMRHEKPKETQPH